MPLSNEEFKKIADSLIEGMLMNLEHNNAHADEIDEADYQRSLKVTPPQAGGNSKQGDAANAQEQT
jgi:hypothetical protein